MNGTGNPGLACYKKFGKHRLKKAEEAVSLGDVLLFQRVTLPYPQMQETGKARQLACWKEFVKRKMTATII